MKQLLSLSAIVKPFDQQLETILATDASRLKGLGFALLQRGKGGDNQLVHFGSKSLTLCQQRYSMIELECLAIQWSVTKCNYYLRGLPSFDFLTDHRPLVGLFQKHLNTVDTPRLLRLREKLIGYSFNVTWVPGKTHLIADSLSRAPAFEPEGCQNLTIDTAVTCLEENPALLEIVACIDRSYRLIAYTLKNGLEANKLKAKHPAAQYKKIWSWLLIHEGAGKQLILLDSAKILIPTCKCKKLLELLHKAHSGYKKILQNSWPALLLAWYEERHRTDNRQLQSLPGGQIQQGSEHYDTARSFKHRAANGRSRYRSLGRKWQGLAANS